MRICPPQDGTDKRNSTRQAYATAAEKRPAKSLFCRNGSNPHCGKAMTVQSAIFTYYFTPVHQKSQCLRRILSFGKKRKDSCRKNIGKRFHKIKSDRSARFSSTAPRQTAPSLPCIPRFTIPRLGSLLFPSARRLLPQNSPPPFSEKTLRRC